MKLKPCPFCGGEAKYLRKTYSDNNSEAWDIRCDNIECYLSDGADFHFPAESEAAWLWNQRTPDPLAGKVIEAAIKCQASRKKDFSGIVHPADQELYDAVTEYQKVTP